jgi:hypothetical protein
MTTCGATDLGVDGRNPAAEAASHQGRDLEAALVSPSTLASAYRATTDFTPREDGGRASQADDYRLGYRVSDP